MSEVTPEMTREIWIVKRSFVFVSVFLALLVAQTISAQQASAPSSNPPATQSKPAAASQPPSEAGNPEIKVWVNTSSGVYHCPGTHWYGATKAGTYMKQSEAQNKGYRAAYHRVCK